MKPAITELRKDILQLIENARQPLSVKTIHESLYPRPDLSTVYRALNFFQAKNLVRCLSFSNNIQYFYSAQKPHSHFILCQKCSRIDSFNQCVAAPLEKEIERQFDFKITDHFFYFVGLCKDCHKGGASQ